jgi:hypothetical protein
MLGCKSWKTVEKFARVQMVGGCRLVDSSLYTASSIIIGNQATLEAEEAMKTLIVAAVAVAAVSLVAGLACEVNAEGYSNAHKRHAKRHYYPRYATRIHGYKQAYPDANGWYPHDSNELKFGSKLWWDQMLRENRLNSGGGRD